MAAWISAPPSKQAERDRSKHEITDGGHLQLHQFARTAIIMAQSQKLRVLRPGQPGTFEKVDETFFALCGRQFTFGAKQNRVLAFANSRGTSVLTQLQLLRVTRAGSACRGTPSQGVPPTPLLCFLEDTRTLGRCPKPRWGLNPQTPLALRGCQLSIYIRRKAKSCAAKRRTYSRGTTNWRNHKNCASCVQAQPGWGLYSK